MASSCTCETTDESFTCLKKSEQEANTLANLQSKRSQTCEAVVKYLNCQNAGQVSELLFHKMTEIEIIVSQINKLLYKQKGRPKERQTDRPPGRQADRQTGGQADRQLNATD